MMDLQEDKAGLLRRFWRWFEAFACRMEATEQELLEHRLDRLETRLAKVERTGEQG